MDNPAPVPSAAGMTATTAPESQSVESGGGRADGPGRSRRGGRRRRGRGGRGGEGSGLPMSGTEGGEGSAGSDSFRLQHSDGPSEGNGAARERAPESNYEAPAQSVNLPPPPPPPESRPSVVWSSSASAAETAPRGDREE
jgi:hypothetical protein